MFGANMRIHQCVYGIAFIILAACGASLAADESKYRQAYGNYMQALESGDRAAVTRYAEEAWRAAEQELGDNRTTAILAYNYARWIYQPDPAAAIEPLQRAIAIAGEDNDMFGADAPILILRYCEARIAEDDRQPLRVLRDLMKEKERAGLAPSLIAAGSWRLLAVHELERKNFGRVKEYAEYAERHFMEGAPEYTRNLAEVLILQGVALISARSRRTDQVEDAFIYFDRAIDLFPAQGGIDSFDSLLATALAWHAATRSAALTDYGLADRTRSRIRERLAKDEGTSRVRWTAPEMSDLECELEWADQEPPEFPERALNRGSLGAAIVGYQLSEDGMVINERLLSEVPNQSEFGSNALESMTQWRLAAPASAECRLNRLAVFRYVIEY